MAEGPGLGLLLKDRQVLGGHSPEDEFAVLQCSAWTASFLQEAHLFVEGQVEAPRSKTACVSQSHSRAAVQSPMNPAVAPAHRLCLHYQIQ